MFTRTARLYISVVIGLGVAAFGWALASLRIPDGPGFATLAALAIFGGALKIRVPGVEGSLSLSFLPLVLTSVTLPLADAIVIAATATLAQAVLSRRFRLVQVSFNCSALSLSIAAAAWAASLLAAPDALLVRLAVSACVYYVCNSALVTTVIGLTGGRSMAEIRNECLRLYLPYLFAGVACGSLALSGQSSGITQGVIVLPAMLLVRHYLKLVASGRRLMGPS